MMENASLDSWDNFLGSNFLKAESVKEGQWFVCTAVELSDDNRPRLHLESNEMSSTFDLNVTNSTALQNAGVKTPKDLVGKKIMFRKVYVTSPTTKKEVQSLRIEKVE